MTQSCSVRYIRRLIDRYTANTLACTRPIVNTRLDFCNALLHGISAKKPSDYSASIPELASRSYTVWSNCHWLTSYSSLAAGHENDNTKDRDNNASNSRCTTTQAYLPHWTHNDFGEHGGLLTWSNGGCLQQTHRSRTNSLKSEGNMVGQSQFKVLLYHEENRQFFNNFLQWNADTFAKIVHRHDVTQDARYAENIHITDMACETAILQLQPQNCKKNLR